MSFSRVSSTSLSLAWRDDIFSPYLWDSSSSTRCLTWFSSSIYSTLSLSFFSRFFLISWSNWLFSFSADRILSSSARRRASHSLAIYFIFMSCSFCILSSMSSYFCYNSWIYLLVYLSLSSWTLRCSSWSLSICWCSPVVLSSSNFRFLFWITN